MQQFIRLILLFMLSIPVAAAVAGPSVESGPDLSRHPLYSKHDFGTTPNVINFGTQPLFVPAGVITEVMKRDRILRKGLKKIGLEIRFHPFLKGDDINFFLKQGKIDVAIAGDMPTITMAATGDIVVTALAQQGFSSLVARGPLTLAALKGRRIGYPPVSIAHYMLLAALSATGLEEGDVRMVPLENNQMADALATGRVDAIAAWEPVPTITLRKIANAAIIYRYLNSSYLYFSRSLADRHPDAVALIVASMVRSFAWLKAREGHLRLAGQWNADAGLRFQPQTAALSADEIATLTLKDILSITSAPIIPERDLGANGSLRSKYDFLEAQGKLSPAATWDKVLKSFDRAIITRVLANRKKFQINSFDYDMGIPAK